MLNDKDMTSRICNGELLCDVQLEHLQLKRNRSVEISTISYDILYPINGICVVDGRHVARFQAMILERGRHVLECNVGESAIFEAVIVHVEREVLLTTLPTCREEQRFEMAVLNGISSSISVEELASMCCLSVSTYKRRFAEYFGIPPHRWFLWRRLEIASAMLRRTSLPTFTVATLCGFINVSHFIATFKRRYGITPSRLLRDEMSSVAMATSSPRQDSRIW